MSRNSFKFTLKPSSLSQHTANFNKILEQVPVPKIDSIDLKISNLEHKPEILIAPKPIETTIFNTKDENNDSTVTVATPFVFGEKLTDRVINASSVENDESNNKSPNKNIDSNKDNDKNSESKPFSIWNENDIEKYSTDALENNDVNTVIRMNCKLFVLEKDKINWLERGYGILKVIDSNDGLNCKIMMWTDKCYRLILNTKLFETMKIDQANKKTIRFNAYDEGTIRIFLIKCVHQNECEELYYKMIERLKTYKGKINSENEYKNEVTSPSQSDNDNKEKEKEIIFKCNCDVITDTQNELSTVLSEIQLYHVNSYQQKNENLSPNNQRLLLDIIDKKDESITISTCLRLIKLINQEDKVEFEIKSSQNSNYKVQINNSESSAQFLNYLKKEPTFGLTCNETSSNDSESIGTEDKSEDDEDEEQIELTKSKRETTNTDEEESSSQELDESKKRKTEDDSLSENEKKKQNLNEDESKFLNLKRAASSSSAESSQESNEHSFKKSKVTETE